MTLLVASIDAPHVSELAGLAAQAFSEGADAVELRIDGLTDQPERLADLAPLNGHKTWIVTCRSQQQGGGSTLSPQDRLALSLPLADRLHAHLDFEAEDWARLTGEQRPSVFHSSKPATRQRRLILSHHEWDAAAQDVPAIIRSMLGAEPQAIAKAAFVPRDICDTFSALDAMHEFQQRSIAVAMGDTGAWCRILAKKLGAFASFATISHKARTAPGQWTVGDMIARFRWRKISESTRVFGVLGDPVAHSMSPLIFNRWFDEMGIDAVYLPIPVRGNGESLTRFLAGCLSRPYLGIEGFSVTLPHKQAAAAWAGEGADRMVRSIAAANTLMLNSDTPQAFNTDCHAAVDSLVAALGCTRPDLLNLPVDILGSGGTAQALVAGLAALGCKITIFGRSPEKAMDLARRFSCESGTWQDRTSRFSKVLINTTSVGFGENASHSPMPADALTNYDLVFDVIYNPLETRLLRDARAAGVATLNGLDMFIRQASMQFELWIGQKPDQQSARSAVETEVARLIDNPAPAGQSDE